MIHHHSPKASIIMRGNLSPGPSYKMKERNSLFDHKNKNSEDIEKNQKLVMVKPDKYCSVANERMLHFKQPKISQSNARGATQGSMKMQSVSGRLDNLGNQEARKSPNMVIDAQN